VPAVGLVGLGVPLAAAGERGVRRLGQVRRDPGRGQLLRDVPPPGAPLGRERDVIAASEPGQPGPQVLPVSRADLAAPHLPSDRDRQDAELTIRIAAEHKRSKGRYGAPRIHAELRGQGRRHSRKRIARLMRQAGIAGRAPRRWKKTTIPDPAAAARADAIRRDFTADAAKINTRWCGDITYIATWEGWLYLATVLDIASRRGVRPGRSPAHRAGR
jgi:hypothetical protein